MVTNGCNDHAREYDGELWENFNDMFTSFCEAQSVPAYNASTAVPSLGRTGVTFSGGVNIYSAFEAGFYDCSDQQPCACGGADCG